MRRQLRPFYTPAELAGVYDHTYDHTKWPDHIERVAKTAAILDDFARTTLSKSVADLSCGDGAIVKKSLHSWSTVTLGDYTSTGPIEQAIEEIAFVDMFVCSETLEHVEDPDALLRSIRLKSKYLILTTPCDEADDRNPEHYWGWGVEDLRHMLIQTGWADLSVQLFTPSSVDYYTFQIWTAK